MGDLGSSYSVLQNVPVMVSPHYRLPKQINVAGELLSIPQDPLRLNQYSFAVERQTLETVANLRLRQQQEERMLADQVDAYHAERLQRQKAAARKIAPGFLDTDTRILHPQPFHNGKTAIEDEFSATSPSTTNNAQITAIPTQNDFSPVASPHQHHQARMRSSSTSSYPDKRISGQSPLDYQKFEQGLAPLDPWDTPENDFVALRSLLGSDKVEQTMPASYATATSSSSASMPMPAPQYPSPYVQHAVVQPAAPNSSGANAAPPSAAAMMSSSYSPVDVNNNGPWIRPPPPPPQMYQSQQQAPPLGHGTPPPPPMANGTPHLGPALPPKVYKDQSYASPSSSTSSPPPPPPPPLPPQLSSPKGPPLPPYPVNGSPVKDNAMLTHTPSQPTNDALVQELATMGFSHEQAVDALRKNENDLVRATNFLLDNSM
ncbi:hypothetical protein BC940DRAFT_297753 [Gongronella butleri]|nr:hypothetical protein BC940DRAFT_297753 [Gongronella butleri]